MLQCENQPHTSYYYPSSTPSAKPEKIWITFLLFTRLKIKPILNLYLLTKEKRWPILKCYLLENPPKADTFLQELNRIILYIIKTLKPLLIYQIWPWCLVITKDVISPLSIHYKHTSNIAEGASGFKRHLLWNDRLRHVMH